MLSQIFINSILSATLLALVALGFNLIFNTTKIFHLAHGALLVSCIYSFHGFYNWSISFLPSAFSFISSVIFAFLIVSILIVLVEHLVYRPLYKKNVSSAISLISSLGVYFLLVNIISLFFGNESISLYSNSVNAFSNSYFKLTNIESVNLIISAVLISLVFLFSRTKFYFNLKAISDNYAVSEKFGLDVQKMRIMALVLGSVLAGCAGIMKGFEVATEPNIGLNITLTASVAVIVGGVNSLKGTVIACFVIAFIENFSVLFLTAQWKDLLTYSLLIAVLVLYQQGLISVKQRIEKR